MTIHGGDSLTVRASLIAVLAGHSAAYRGFVSVLEEEPNNSLLTAQPVPMFAPIPFGIASIDGALSPSDLVFFQVQFEMAVLFTATLIDLSGALQTGGDAYLAVFDDQGAMLYFNDDLIPSFGVLAGIQNQPLPAGSYFFAVTGEADSLFDGSHSQELDYRLRIQYHPVPAPACGLGVLALLLCPAHRRRP